MCVSASVLAGHVRRLAASEGGCNTLDPRFIFLCVFVKKKRTRNQNSEERRAGEKDEEEEEEEEEGGVAKIG